MDNLNTVFGTYLLSISVILILYALSYAKIIQKN